MVPDRRFVADWRQARHDFRSDGPGQKTGAFSDRTESGNATGRDCGPPEGCVPLERKINRAILIDRKML
jgi:hypothetical protein